MSRERKVNIHCSRCGRSGIEYITEEYSNGYWHKVDSALSSGWDRYVGGFILCPECDRNPKAQAELGRKIKAYKKAKLKESILTALALSIGFCLTIIIWINYGSFFYGTIPTILALLACAFIKEGIKGGLGCSVTLVIAVVAYFYFFHEDNSNTPQDNPSPNEISKPVKQSAYLNGISDISNNSELGNFYFAIANNFYHNDMGLKGTPEQIAAGNKLMVRVYDFLGTSAKKEQMLNVDSMKFFIKNYTQVSEFRRKKALEELQLGINKIESINK